MDEREGEGEERARRERELHGIIIILNEVLNIRIVQSHCAKTTVLHAVLLGPILYNLSTQPTL